MPIHKEYARYIGLGAEIAASLLVPIGIGYAVDTYFDLNPIGILTGSFVGLLLFFLLILRVSRDFKEK